LVKSKTKNFYLKPHGHGVLGKNPTAKTKVCINGSREHPLQGLGRRPMTLTLWLDLELALDLNIEKEGEPNEL
jgi:hypothetical protein